jgi:hypothetical protein
LSALETIIATGELTKHIKLKVRTHEKTITLVAIASLFIGCGNSIRRTNSRQNRKNKLP